MIKAYIDFWKRALDFKGRSSRSDYWWAYLVNFLIVFVFTIVFVVIPLFSAVNVSGMSVVNDSQSFAVLATSYSWPIVLLSLILLLPQFSLQVRRLRDAGFQPAWATLIFMGWIPVVKMFSLFGSIALIVMSCMPTKDEQITVIDQD